jgi:stalled ribosome alternative rescue factor ArfA
VPQGGRPAHNEKGGDYHGALPAVLAPSAVRFEHRLKKKRGEGSYMRRTQRADKKPSCLERSTLPHRHLILGSQPRRSEEVCCLEGGSRHPAACNRGAKAPQVGGKPDGEACRAGAGAGVRPGCREGAARRVMDQPHQEQDHRAAREAGNNCYKRGEYEVSDQPIHACLYTCGRAHSWLEPPVGLVEPSRIAF